MTHEWQRPQLGIQLSTTWSPSATECTSGPTASTMPAPSWPPIAGSDSIGRSPTRTCSSEWHRPEAARRTSTSPALGPSSVSSSISHSPPYSHRAAVCVFISLRASVVVLIRRARHHPRSRATGATRVALRAVALTALSIRVFARAAVSRAASGVSNLTDYWSMHQPPAGDPPAAAHQAADPVAPSGWGNRRDDRWLERWIRSTEDLARLQDSHRMLDAVIAEVDCRPIRVGERGLATV